MLLPFPASLTQKPFVEGAFQLGPEKWGMCMWTNGAIVKKLGVMTVIVLAGLSSACQGGGDEGSSDLRPVTFASDVLQVTALKPGEMLQLDIQGSVSKVAEGVFVRFTGAGHDVVVPALHADTGVAFVMVPPLATTLTTGVELKLVDVSGVVRDTHAQTISIDAAATSAYYTRASFDAAIGAGLARFPQLAIECVDVLETNSFIPASDATIVRSALDQQADILGSIGFFNDNLSNDSMALVQQLLENSRFLELISKTGGVSLTGTGSQTSPLHGLFNGFIQSALLKADFASVVIGEIRGVLNLIAWVGTQLSSVPLIGSYAQDMATWAQGVSASMVPTHDIINTMIPCDLVQITAPSNTVTVPFGGTTDVRATGRFETEEAFDVQKMQQFIASYVQQAAARVTTMMSVYSFMAPYAGYVQQAAAVIPGWITAWLTSKGYIGTSVVPGQGYTVFAIPSFELDMSQYRFDAAGIVANILNIPYSTMVSIFNWIGFGLGSPVAGYEGVVLGSGAVTYLPTADDLEGTSKGTTTATYTSPVGQKAGGWWAQWGFYAIHKTEKAVTVVVQ